MEANAFAVLTLARAAADVDAVLVHYSSDFVFDGAIDRPYTESDRPAPQSVYAASKLLGEWFAAETPSHYVLRVESLFGGVALRKSSLDRIIDAVVAGGPVKAFVDRVVSPSYAWDVVEATRAMLEARPPAGLYHCVNTGAGDLVRAGGRGAAPARQRRGDRADHPWRGAAASGAAEVLRAVERQAPRRRHCDADLAGRGRARSAERRTKNEERRTKN